MAKFAFQEWMKKSKLFKLSIIAMLTIFLSLGYGLVGTQTGQCLAQRIGYFPAGPRVGVPGGMCRCCKGCVEPCEPAGTAVTTAQLVQSTVFSSLSTLAIGSENFMRGMVIDPMMSILLERIHTMEVNMIEWWETMWYYNLRPSMQAITEQLNVAAIEQSRNLQAAFDADIANDVMRQQKMNEQASFKEVTGENGCPTATLSGGLARGTEINRSMRTAWQMESTATGSNRLPDVGTDQTNARGVAAVNFRENKVFEENFCDPDDNGGENICAASSTPAFYNADTRVTEFMYNKETIPVGNAGDGAKYKLAVQQQIENLTGSTKLDPVPERVLDTPQGQESWVDRRSYLARHAALSSVPQLTAGWRMPGTRVGQWSEEVRTAAGVPANQISDNPSYREVMKASTVDRFNSGQYALTNIAEPLENEREKLRLSVQYLMLLRDYNDLLERVALTLATQVSMMAEDIPLPNVPARTR